MMPRPHPALFPVAAGRELPPVTDRAELVRSAREHRMGGLVWSRVSRDVDHSAWWELAALDMLSEEGR